MTELSEFDKYINALYGIDFQYTGQMIKDKMNHEKGCICTGCILNLSKIYYFCKECNDDILNTINKVRSMSEYEKKGHGVINCKQCWCFGCSHISSKFQANLPNPYHMVLSVRCVKCFMIGSKDIIEKILIENKQLKDENTELKEEILHLKYQPGGEGAKEAQKHFEELVNKK